MRISKILGVKWVLVAFVALTTICATLPNSFVGATYATNINTSDLHNLANQERANVGLPALSYNSQLSNAAYNKANYMIANNYWAHVAPDGTTPWYFIQASGYSYTVAGENLAKDFSSSSGVIAGWMASPTHHANVVNSSYQDVGYAVVNGMLQGSETTIVVAMYGAQNAPAPVVAVAADPVPQSTPVASVPPTATSPAPVTEVVAASEPEAVLAAEVPATEQTPVVSENVVDTKAKTDPKNNSTVTSAPVVLGATSFLGKIYNSVNNNVKLAILIVGNLVLVATVCYLFIIRKNKKSNKHIWFKKQLIASSIIVVVLIAIVAVNYIGLPLNK